MANDVSKLAVVYCRVSSDKQATEDKGSLDDQEASCRAKAQELGLQVLYTVKDAESAWILEKRSKFQAILDDARAGKFGVLIVDRMNRFTRGDDTSDFTDVMTDLRRAGVTPIFAQRDYDRDPRTGKLTRVGAFMQFADAYASSQEQANRISQALVGKRTRARRDGHPLPGSWAKYGYRWVDARKTQMDKDDGQSQRIVERIWAYFLHEQHATLSGMAKQLNREHVRTPREYAGIKTPSNARDGRLHWTAYTIGTILHDPVYWGGDEDGQVTTFTDSKHEEPVRIPAYAPAYVTPAEATRVHARLESNQRYAARNGKREWHTLLHGGLVRCAECGWALTPYQYKRPRTDGSLLTVYRCQQSGQRGKEACTGVAISADTLDFAVIDKLDSELAHGQFLDELFAAWERDAETAMGEVRRHEATLAETRTYVANAMARLMTYAPGDPLAGPLEAQARMIQESIPGLEDKVSKALQAVNKARANPALRDELREWFQAWMSGFHMLSTARQRDFLMAIKARVELRTSDCVPRARLHIELTTTPETLPPALELDTEAGEQLAVLARQKWDNLDIQPPTDETSTADEAMAGICEELTEQGYGASVACRVRNAPVAYGPSGRTATAASSSSCARPTSRG
jgi:DNA invertase Pin-like site-specific DNA recombinase